MLKKKATKKMKAAITKSIERGKALATNQKEEHLPRTDIEIALGRKMHQVGKEQAIFQASQGRLQRLQQEANVLDDKLKNLDAK